MTKPEFLVAKEKMLVALAAVSVAILSPDYWQLQLDFFVKAAAYILFSMIPLWNQSLISYAGSTPDMSQLQGQFKMLLMW